MPSRLVIMGIRLFKDRKDLEGEIMLKFFNLYFIDKCNYYCRHCFVKKENFELEMGQIIMIINNVKRYFIKNKIKDGRINLAGGEPLMSKNIQEIIDIIFSNNINISLVTNGSLLTKEFIRNNSRNYQ